MHTWQASLRVFGPLLRFLGRHAWLPAVLFPVVAATYKVARWASQMIPEWLARREEEQALRFLATQINPEGGKRDSYNNPVPRQLEVHVRDIASALGKKIVKVNAILERLEAQKRVARRGDFWHISDRELDDRSAPKGAAESG